MTYPREAIIQMPVPVYDETINQERQDAARSAIDELNALRDNLRNALQLGATDDPVTAVVALVTLRDNQVRELAQQKEAYRLLNGMHQEVIGINTSLQNENADLRVRLAKLEALPVPDDPMPDTQPIVIPDPVTIPKPTTLTPVITRTELRNMAGVTLTLDEAPSPAKDQAAREVLKLVAEMGFNAVRFMRNFGELMTDAKNNGGLIAYAQSLNLIVLLDSLDNVLPKLDPTRQRIYADTARSLKVAGFFFNDFDRAELDGSRRVMADEFYSMTTLPIFASLMGSAKLDEYKSMVDWCEIQTFGTASEFTGTFIKSPAPVLCIDGQRGATLTYLDKVFDAMLADKQDCFMVYTALYQRKPLTDWRTMPDMVAVYKDFIQKWKAQRQ